MKKAFICGASSGIGLCLAQRLIKEGYSVTNCSRRPCQTEGVENITADLSDCQKRAEVISALNSAGAIDLFVYSAGYSMCAPFEYVSPQDLRYLFEVDFFAACELTAAIIQLMKEKGGTIVYVSSVAGFAPIAYDAYYTAAKAALNALAIELNTELNSYGIRVKSVCPGGTATDFTFKRKVYSEDTAREYYPQMLSAAAALARTEQGGAVPNLVAEQIMRAVNCSAVVVPLGIKNKLIRLLTLLSPTALQVFLLKQVFNCNK